MSQQLALCVYGCVIVWLCFVDVRRRSNTSSALWLVIVWVAVFASRPVSAWLNLGGNEVPLDVAEGNPTDRNFFLCLILAACFVLKKRNVNWHAVISKNRWLFCLYLYLGLSVFWSDYSFISFKRWIKDIGNVLMVLVILTERDPLEAIQAVFVRTAYILIPLSVLLAKYYPELARSFNPITGEAFYSGAALGKNVLGITLLVLTVFLVWTIVRRHKLRYWTTRKGELAGCLLVLLMAMWLFHLANSATSMVCALIGVAAIVALSMEWVRNRLRLLFGWCIAGMLMLLLVNMAVDLKGRFAEMLGRDPTLHGRTDIWSTVLAENTNPLIGTGYYSFWLGGRAEKIAAKKGYLTILNQAHNGYLEMYLNAGLIGGGLLIAMLISSARRMKQHVLADPDWGGVRLVFWSIVVVHNLSEASFFVGGPLWFVLLLVILEYSPVTNRAFAAQTSDTNRNMLKPEIEVVPVPQPVGDGGHGRLFDESSGSI